ncbi:hypothetical protein MKX01_024092 [Papaver californicum]|nr:hypothetical protein MKX01_024092 [Papaver californicum]
MASTQLTQSPYRNGNPSFHREFPNYSKPISQILKPNKIRFLSSSGKVKIRCQLTSFENPHKWSRSDDRIPEIDHHNFHSSISALPMATNSIDSSSTQQNSKRVCLFYCTEFKSLAERVAAQSDSIELRSITWSLEGIRGQHVFLASFSSPAVIFEQLSVIYALPKLFISLFTLLLPFFPTGTSERVEEEGDIATTFSLARILSNVPHSRGGPTSLVIFDIHALQERFYFEENVLPCFESGIPLLKSRLQQLPNSDNIIIAFPDDGACKRFYKQLQHFPMIICTKVREGDQRIVRLKEGDPKGRHVVIVDDLVQSGGTLIECQQKISAYVTHGIFPNRSWERFEPDIGGSPENGMTYFWVTDSCPLTVREVKNRRPFQILSLASSIAASLQI